VVKELSAACKSQGLAFGTYYSTCDWHHPDFPLGSPGGKTKKPSPNMDAYTDYLRAQVSELITNYGPLLVVWFDVPQETGPDRGIPTANLVRTLQPDILINNRVYRLSTPGQKTDLRDAVGDYSTPEQRIGGFNMERPWETCMTICHQWAWKPDDPMKSLKQCLQTLILTAAGNGNLLFNVGPMPDGRIEARQVRRLKEMGAWMSKYGESIYGTRGGPWKPNRNVASTRKGNTVFVHVLRQRGDAIILPDIPRKIMRSSVLTGGRVSVDQGLDQIAIRIKPAANPPEHGAELLISTRTIPPGPEVIDTIVKLELDGSAMDLAPIEAPSAIKASASNVFKNDERYRALNAFDDDTGTRWATDASTRQAWLAADLGRPSTVERVRIDEAIDERVQKFEFQYRAGQEWKTLFTGQKIGRWFQQGFKPVTAQEFRLNILEASNGPTITDIELIEK
jgi:alpha-L-fucosidase